MPSMPPMCHLATSRPTLTAPPTSPPLPPSAPSLPRPPLQVQASARVATALDTLSNDLGLADDLDDEVSKERAAGGGR